MRDRHVLQPACGRTLERVAVGSTEEDRPLSGRAIGGLAVVVAISVANGYYVQPLLIVIAGAIELPHGSVGLLPALSQIGLALGLVTLLPLADVYPTRRVLLIVLPLQIAAVAIVANGRDAFTIMAGFLAIGIFGIAPYALPPYASLNVSSQRLGPVTGILAAAVICGILLARSLAGVVAVNFGWRWVYAFAAIATAFAIIIVVRVVRPQRPAAKIGYRQLAQSLAGMLRSEPALRTAAICQALSFGSFNVFWLGSTLYLHGHFGWKPDAIGYAGLLGALAAFCSPLFGRATTRFGSRPTRLVALATVVVAWAVLAVLRGSLAGMAIGLVALNLGAVASDIANRTILYELTPNIRTRLNAVYTIVMFAGGAVMSTLVGVFWAWEAWLGVCALGAASASASVFVAFGAQRRTARKRN